ncbi:MAG TPA: hypothetical protein VD969_05145 [Symbiobacteriaceae bacterium]|nr:hypothetical protein [Symbiobacteriaceae bacterium]
MRRFLVLMIVTALLAAGCARHPSPPPRAEPGGSTATPAAGQTPLAEPSQPAPDPSQPARDSQAPGSHWQPEPAGGLKAVVTEAPADTFVHHQIKPGQPINSTGLFFMKVATSEVEGWSLGGDQNRWPQYDVSDDNRWVSASEQEEHYLLDRKSGVAYQWRMGAAALLAARGENLLFRTGSRFWIVRDGFKLITPVDLPPTDMPRALFAPNGESAVIENGSKIYLLNSENASVREIGRIAVDEANVSFATLRDGQEVVVRSDPVVFYQSRPEYRVQRYGWTGKQMADLTTPGRLQFSPDGRLAVWPDSLLGMVGVLVVGSGPDLAPRFRLVGADGCPTGGPVGDPWLADSSGLVVRTGQGYQLLRADGGLTQLGALGGDRTWEMPVPAPDRADRFVIGGVKVVDEEGRLLAAAVPHAEGQWYGVRGSPWGDTSDEVRLILVSGGKDYGCLGAVLPPKVEMAPFPTVTGMEVSVAANDCVNLRQDFSRDAPVITCMPNGTRLVAAKPPGRLNKGYLDRFDSLMVTNMGGEGWWFVRTENGRRGWVMLSGEYLRLAVAGSGDPPADPVAALVADETANMLHWFSVAAGEIRCGDGCGGGTWAEPIWALGEWCRQSGFGYIRQLPGFDPTRHGVGATALENGCKALRTAWETLGEPTDIPAWRQKVAEVKTSLEAGR